MKNAKQKLSFTLYRHNVKDNLHFCKIHFTILLIVAVLQSGCAKNASETAAEASLSQVNAIEQQIKKDCPMVNYDKQMESLRNSIKTQLATCEAQKATLQERNNTLLAILIGLVAIIIALNWAKIKTRIFGGKNV